jgi:hypothetical protein
MPISSTLIRLDLRGHDDFHRIQLGPKRCYSLRAEAIDFSGGQFQTGSTFKSAQLNIRFVFQTRLF